jgi:hypothetical protein
MLGCFPDPYPDELLYSVCARFQARMQYPSKKSAPRELFGSTTHTAAIDLPSRLNWLVYALPPHHHYSVEQLIENHTLLPFYSPFLPPKRVTQLRADMSGDGGLILHRRSGVMASRVSIPKWLRFCVRCVEEDQWRYGETYWHRLHQTSGVEVCPTNQLFLEDSHVRRDAGRETFALYAAEDVVRAVPLRRISPTDKSNQVLFMLARGAAWLLEHPSSGSDFTVMHDRYLRQLIERGLATYTGSIHVAKLLNEFGKHYPPVFLRSLGCEFTSRDQVKTNWLLRLARPHKHAQHPLYHLLLMQFLGHTVEEFFRLPTELNLFGEGPWPCLNPAAEHFREPVIPEYKLSSRLRNNHPTATFSCACGFAYARTGPDSSHEDRFRIGRIISFGLVWEAQLKQLWKNASMSLSELGCQLGVDPLTVRRHAARLKLPFSRHGGKSKPLKLEAQLKGNAASQQRQEKRRNCRLRWRSAAERDPTVELKELRHRLPREYAWLSQNDSEWLGRYSPPPEKRARTKSNVDWQRRDIQYAVAVKDTALHLKNAPGRPTLVSKTAIGRALGAVTLLQQKLHKMPLTAQVLANMVESREDYAVRRIWWVADMYSKEKFLPQEWQLIMRASVYGHNISLKIRRAIASAIRKIKSELALELPMQAIS